MSIITPSGLRYLVLVPSIEAVGNWHPSARIDSLFPDDVIETFLLGRAASVIILRAKGLITKFIFDTVDSTACPTLSLLRGSNENVPWRSEACAIDTNDISVIVTKIHMRIFIYLPSFRLYFVRNCSDVLFPETCDFDWDASRDKYAQGVKKPLQKQPRPVVC